MDGKSVYTVPISHKWDKVKTNDDEFAVWYKPAPRIGVPNKVDVRQVGGKI